MYLTLLLHIFATLIYMFYNILHYTAYISNQNSLFLKGMWGIKYVLYILCWTKVSARQYMSQE